MGYLIYWEVSITFFLLHVNVKRDLKQIEILTIFFQEECPNKLKFKVLVMQILFQHIWFSALKWLIRFQLYSA